MSYQWQKKEYNFENVLETTERKQTKRLQILPLCMGQCSISPNKELNSK